MGDQQRPGMGDEEMAYDQLVGDDISSELSSNRTALSLFRTEMSSDRTLMSVIRTSLSLIGFGFTIFSFFHMLKQDFLAANVAENAPARFGGALVGLGVVLLLLGMINHVRSVLQLRHRRDRLFELGLIRHVSRFRVSTVMIVAIALLAIGLLAIVAIAFREGPF
ncbi:putative membrane protein [Sphingomonas laterariae]|uniref:Putative membrane protein n=1 Tax=Edaphosphingomonas laterariae TaxID=861865 RepID=A0A239JGI4_9SPHN|nr:DUF202 domain-containing protein [Sphingomonas laterariae]SNT04403.1 putative membrane protein [Sphingomonas laterariae]